MQRNLRVACNRAIRILNRVDAMEQNRRKCESVVRPIQRLWETEKRIDYMGVRKHEAIVQYKPRSNYWENLRRSPSGTQGHSRHERDNGWTNRQKCLAKCSRVALRCGSLVLIIGQSCTSGVRVSNKIDAMQLK